MVSDLHFADDSGDSLRNDIVILLRKYQPYNKLHGQAADEIERLRAELAISKHECQMADDAVQDLQARLIKAVRHD